LSQQINKAKLVVEDLEFNVTINVEEYPDTIMLGLDKELIETYGTNWCYVYFTIHTNIEMPYPTDYSLSFNDSLSGLQIHTFGKYANEYNDQKENIRTEIIDSIKTLIDREIKDKNIEVKKWHMKVGGNAEVLVSDIQ
jgi:hypothetical protein